MRALKCTTAVPNRSYCCGPGDELGLQVGDAAVLEAQVRAGGRQGLLHVAVVGGELAEALLERGVLRGDPLDGFLGPFGLQVADLGEEFADAGALGEDLDVGGFEGVLGVSARSRQVACWSSRSASAWPRRSSASTMAAATALRASGLLERNVP
ncbi:hypothetical protein [Amycolatopsis anabasis]|uniref:hypothetical protein n=1 Tax=Amycolatopsis anabasis TaxID=1840409 RepID=UPI00131CE31F|nr:hypothetical protein [Amycolatopsis anabasis]